MPASYPDLKDKTVLVTGGASGIGATLVGALRRAGRPRRLSRHRARRRARRSPPVSASACASRPATCATSRALRAAVERVRGALGPITGLLNNAAHDDRHDTLEVSDA